MTSRSVAIKTSLDLGTATPAAAHALSAESFHIELSIRSHQISAEQRPCPCAVHVQGLGDGSKEFMMAENWGLPLNLIQGIQGDILIKMMGVHFAPWFGNGCYLDVSHPEIEIEIRKPKRELQYKRLKPPSRRILWAVGGC